VLHWSTIVVAIFLAGMVVSAAHLAAGLVAVRRLIAGSRPLEDAPLNAEVASLRQRLDIIRPVSLYESTEVATPATVGWRRPAILLPTPWHAWGDAERRAGVARDPALAQVRLELVVKLLREPVGADRRALADGVRGLDDRDHERVGPERAVHEVRIARVAGHHQFARLHRQRRLALRRRGAQRRRQRNKGARHAACAPSTTIRSLLHGVLHHVCGAARGGPRSVKVRTAITPGNEEVARLRDSASVRRRFASRSCLLAVIGRRKRPAPNGSAPGGGGRCGCIQQVVLKTLSSTLRSEKSTSPSLSKSAAGL
ncbi:MAG: hypothetical protein IBJ10_06810, partial [Phycisphaerales bacterium]|nr:hypothetical protein [Phycisphaerales bacterium]